MNSTDIALAKQAIAFLKGDFDAAQLFVTRVDRETRKQVTINIGFGDAHSRVNMCNTWANTLADSLEEAIQNDIDEGDSLDGEYETQT